MILLIFNFEDCDVRLHWISVILSSDMPLKTAVRQKIFSSFRRVTQAAAFIASLCKHYPQNLLGFIAPLSLNQSTDLVTRKLYTQALAAGTTSTHAHRS